MWIFNALDLAVFDLLRSRFRHKAKILSACFANISVNFQPISLKFHTLLAACNVYFSWKFHGNRPSRSRIMAFSSLTFCIATCDLDLQPRTTKNYTAVETINLHLWHELHVSEVIFSTVIEGRRISRFGLCDLDLWCRDLQKICGTIPRRSLSLVKVSCLWLL